MTSAEHRVARHGARQDKRRANPLTQRAARTTARALNAETYGKAQSQRRG
jgi:hypothetical protein